MAKVPLSFYLLDPIYCDEFPANPKHNNIVFHEGKGAWYIFLDDKWIEYVPPTHYILGEDKPDGTWIFHGLFSSGDPQEACVNENYFYASVVDGMLLDGSDLRDGACYPKKKETTHA